MLGDYLAHLTTAGRGDATIKAYGSDLRDFETTETGVRRYSQRTTLGGLKPASRQRKIASARLYCKWLEGRGVGVGDWRRILKPPSSIAFLPPAPLDPADLERLLTAPTGTEPFALRDRAMLRLLIETGCRVSEMVNLDVGHVLPTRSVVVAAGTAKEREVPLGGETAHHLAAWTAHGRHPLAGPAVPTLALFLNNHGTRLTRQGCWLIVRGHCTRAGIGAISPSQLRHAAADRLVAFASDVSDAQYLLGHASVQTTLLYRQAARRRAA